MNLEQQILQSRTRRQFLGNGGVGLGGIALASLLGNRANANIGIDPTQPQQPRNTHAPAKAKRVIYLHMTGSPPILDLFDYKPELIKREGQNCPDEFLKGKRFAFTSGVPKLMGTPHKFQRHGQSGALFSDALPHLARQADDLTFIKSMTTDQFNHAPAELLLYTGSSIAGRPSMGSWITYGLGSENQDLPGFVALISSGVQPNGGKNSFGSGFLPSVFQGVQCRSKGDPVLYVSDPKGLPRQLRRSGLDTLNELNRIQAKELGSPETLTRIAQYEMAFRMQTSVPEVMDITKEPSHVLEAYGAKPGGSSLANNCLLARRMIERGVRCVNIYHSGWDAHSNVAGNITSNANTTDQASAALILDLKQRGLLDDTLLIWGGEFGRTPMVESNPTLNRSKGRDHHPQAFSLWLAGGGIKGGITLGSTDELGFHIAERPVHIHDLQATILHLLGLDHERLIFNHGGRDYRLTDVHGKLVKEIIA